ncbi:MAG: hypothetical protein WAQ98_32040 [Blastocatellia bacterium]
MDPKDGYFRIVYLPELDVLNTVYDRVAEFVHNWQHRRKGAVG